MRRATVTIGDDIEASLDEYIRQQDAAPALSAIMQTALKEYLARRGFVPGDRRFRISPPRKGSGAKDVSIDHDRYLAER
jgi:hypothetical protein